MDKKQLHDSSQLTDIDDMLGTSSTSDSSGGAGGAAWNPDDEDDSGVQASYPSETPSSGITTNPTPPSEAGPAFDDIDEPSQKEEAKPSAEKVESIDDYLKGGSDGGLSSGDTSPSTSGPSMDDFDDTPKEKPSSPSNKTSIADFLAQSSSSDGGLSSLSDTAKASENKPTPPTMGPSWDSDDDEDIKKPEPPLPIEEPEVQKAEVKPVSEPIPDTPQILPDITAKNEGKSEELTPTPSPAPTSPASSNVSSFDTEDEEQHSEISTVNTVTTPVTSPKENITMSSNFATPPSDGSADTIWLNVIEQHPELSYHQAEIMRLVCCIEKNNFEYNIQRSISLLQRYQQILSQK